MNNDELFDLVRENYASANADYISEQIRIASEHLMDEQKEKLREKILT